MNLLDIIGLLFILLFMAQLIAVIRIYKGGILKSIRIMASVSLRSGKAFLLFGGTIALFCSIFQSLLSSWIPPFPPVLLTGLGLVALGGACLPPGLIYLGASQSSGFFFVQKLMSAIAPMKVTHLLNSFEAGAILGDQVHQSEYRVTKGWQEAVRSLCNIAPLIILDSRIITPYVLEEVQHILNSDNKHRTIFLSEKDGSSPILKFLDDSHNGFVFTLTPEAAVASLNGVGWRSLIRGRKAINEMIETGFLLRE